MSHRKQNNNNTNIPSKSKGKPSFPQSAEKKEAKYETGSIEGSAKKTPQEVASPKKEELIQKSIDEATSPGPPEDLAVTLSKEEPSLLLGRTEKKQDADSYREEFREGELGLHLFSRDDPKEVDSVENLVNLKTGEIQERMNVQFNLMTADLSAQIERLGNRFSQRFEGVEKMHVKFNNDVNENMLGLRQYLFEHLDAMEEKVNKLDSKNKIFEDQNKTFIGEMDMARGSPSLISPIPQTFNKPKVIPEPKPAQAKAAKTNLSSDFADEGFLTNKKKNTRESILKRLSMGADAPVHAVTYTRVAPSYTHIKMERLTLSQLIKFTEDIFAYTTSYKISLPVSTLISDRVRDQLIAHHRGMTVTKFHALSVEDILSYLLKEVRPESPLIFYKTLAQYVKIELPPSYKPTPLDFKLFYNALLVYKDKFIRVYEMLSEDNDVNTPPCNNKEGGLIRLFLEGIPFQYGSKKFQAMSSTSSQKYDDIYSFTRDFMVAVEEDFERSKQATVMSHHFSGTALVATPSKAATRPSQTHATQRFHEVRHVKHQEEEFDDHEDEPESSGDEIDDQEEEESFLQELDALGNDRNNRFTQRSNFSQNNPDRTRAPFTIMRKDKPKTGCFRMLFHGSCEKGDKCSYAHDPNTLSKMHDYYADLLRTSKFKPTRTDVSRNDPVAVIEEAEPDQALLAQVDEFLHLSFSKIREPTEDLAKAVHRQGAVKLPGGTRLLVADALFDTGAVHASYISKQFVDAHHDCLEPYRVKIRKNVQLADKVTIIPVEDAYDLNVSFSDDGGQLHEAKVLFWALPQCNHEMIIGLPAIIHHFHSLHKHMLDVVVDILEKKDSQSLSTVAEVQYPWSYVQEELAPEDLDTPLPSSFPDALHFMEMSHEEAVKEFHSQFEKHVHKDFAEATPILALLKEKGTHVFVPQNWEGIKGVPDIDLELKEGMPQILKPRARPVNPKLYENAKKEFDRLKKYFYRDSNSDIASCLVIAPKATAPFIRFCGDYVAINKFIVTGHYPIPHVQHTLERIIRYNVFLDFDLANSFHQFRLTKRTSALLSVQTPWGQVEPIFMPEGIGPASGILQKAMSQIFADFQEWAIVIFDNLLVMATDYEDAYRKVELVLNRCLHHNVCLKFSKTWLGFSEANFFGYVCRKGCYELSQARKDAIYEFPFPNSLKQMQSFLGSALFFKSFVKNFSSLASPLYDMVKKEFSWDESSWKEVDYRMAFQHFKEALVAATAIYYPNYEYEWILRTDASRFGIGAVLLQVCPVDDNSPPILQPITFFSQKFSDQATRWSTIEQEAYAIFAAVRHFAYYLTCKPFILETDHNNLLYMEQSIVPKIVRWRVYLQSFSFMLRHIPGKENTVADWLSRVHERDTPNTHPVELANAEPTTPEELLRRVHGGRMGHYGARRTWKLLGTFFPGHHIPYHVVEEFVATCPICQKSRLGMTDSIQPVVRHLKPEGRRSMVGVDTLTITPPDKNGFKYLVVIVNHFTKFAVLVPTKTKDALTVAHALFTYFATFGLVDCIISDPGSEYENQLLEHLHSWLGIRHRFSLVERHESNGVEGTNKQILRHLRALVLDERVVSHWVSLIPFIQFMLNSTDNSETGVIPYHAHFGTADETYCRLPLPDGTHEGREGDGTVSIDPADFDIKNMAKLTQAYLSALDKNLAVLYKISKEYQAKIALERTKDTPSDKQNTYQKGDFVLWQRNPDDPLPTKLTTPFVGPFEVLEQYKNDVECRHVLHGNIQKFHVSRLKLFHGNKETAKEVAQLDQDQHTIKTIHSHRGDPALRSTMTFKVEFEDGDIRMLPWSKDLFDSLPYESYCRNHPELTSLLYTVDLAKTFERDLSKTPITAVKPGDECFVDLRYLGHLWYDEQVPFEDKDETYYLLHGRYYTWENKTHTKISIKFSVLKQVYVVDNIFIQRYRRVFPENGAKLVDEALVKEYPILLKQNQKGGRANSSTTKKR